jgi:hypothetical protein
VKAAAAAEPQSFMAAVDALAHRSPTPLDKIAERIGRSANYLRKACSQYDEAHPFRGDLIVPMTLASADADDDRNFVVVEYLARAVGGVFYHVPTAFAKFALTADVLKEVGEYLQAIADGSRDHRYTAEEVARIRREGMQVVRAILADIEGLEQQLHPSSTVVPLREAHR